MKQHYIQITTTLFIDPHGSADDGGIDKSLVSGKKWDEQYREQQLPENEDKQYCDGEWLSENYFQGSEDGYNMQYSASYLKPVPEKDVERIKQLLKDYKQL